MLRRGSYHPWNRARTVPHSHSQESSPDSELAVVESNFYAFNSTNSNSTEDISTSLELWGMPVQSIILLNLVAVIWGTQHAVIKGVVDDSDIDIGTGFIAWIDNAGVKSIQPSFVSSANREGGDSTAAYFTLARFGLAAVLASPYTPGWGLILNGVQERLGFIEPNVARSDFYGLTNTSHTQKEQEKSESTIARAWKYGGELGLYMFLGYAFQAIGLETTTASRSGFLLYLNVKLVPFLSFFIFGKPIQQRTWISALVAFGGTALLSLDVASAEKGFGMAITVGDLWSIAAAAASAMFILRMEAASNAVPRASELNAATLWTVAGLSFLWTMITSLHDLSETETVSGVDTVFVQATQRTFQETFSTVSRHLLPLIYLSAVTTALANFLQSKAQKDISAERAAVIYAMDPVYGAIFANVLLGESLGRLGLVGAFLIVLAAAANAVADLGSVTSDQAVKAESSRRNEKVL
jgi:drug/metabolite transporter (DMT)-like permease